MFIIGTFEHSLELEEALVELEHNGISRKQILAIPMFTHPNTNSRSINMSGDFHSKGTEVGISCATAFSVVGTSLGFILKWGPIIWGLTFSLIGFIIGFGLYLLLNRNTHRNISNKLPEVTIIVQCQKEQSNQITSILWRYKALTIGQSP